MTGHHVCVVHTARVMTEGQTIEVPWLLHNPHIQRGRRGTGGLVVIAFDQDHLERGVLSAPARHDFERGSGVRL
jgi:hypothetical protein